MLRALLLAGIPALTILCRATPVAAQFLLAGQIMGVSYTDISPDISLSATPVFANGTAGSYVVATQALDLDKDGRDDLLFQASGSITPGSLYQSYSNGVLTLHSNVQVYVRVALHSVDTIQQHMSRRDATNQAGLWDQMMTYPCTFTSYSYNPLYPDKSLSGDWTDRQDHYLGVRLRNNPTAAWRYGWLRVQVTSSQQPASMLVKDYALTSAVLALQPALAVGWQLYPTRVTDQLTIESPSPTSRATATVYDLCGRPLLWVALSGGRQQVELSGLAAGVYVVQLETPTGRFAQRISKL